MIFIDAEYAIVVRMTNLIEGRTKLKFRTWFELLMQHKQQEPISLMMMKLSIRIRLVSSAPII